MGFRALSISTISCNVKKKARKKKGGRPAVHLNFFADEKGKK